MEWIALKLEPTKERTRRIVSPSKAPQSMNTSSWMSLNRSGGNLVLQGRDREDGRDLLCAPHDIGTIGCKRFCVSPKIFGLKHLVEMLIESVCSSFNNRRSIKHLRSAKRWVHRTKQRCNRAKSVLRECLYTSENRSRS